MAEFQEDIFDEIVAEAKTEQVRTEKKTIRYRHVFDITYLNNEDKQRVERLFRSIRTMVEYRFSRTQWMDIIDKERWVMSADVKEKTSYDNISYVLFTVLKPSYMIYYRIAEYMSTNLPKTFTTDGHVEWTRDQIIKRLSGYEQAVCDDQLRKHVQRICESRKYETKIWSKLSSRVVRDKKIKFTKDFVTGLHVKNMSFSSANVHEYSFDIMEMEAICYKQKKVREYTKNKVQNNYNLITKSKLVETEKNLYLIMQVVDEEPIYRRWLTMSVPKSSSYISNFLDSLNYLVPEDERDDVRNKLKEII